MEANVELHRTGSLKIRQLEKQVRNSQNIVETLLFRIFGCSGSNLSGFPIGYIGAVQYHHI